MIQICFVCLGNICRSPTAEGIMRRLVADAQLDGHIHIDSAGTGGWHVGELPDARARATAERRGVTLDSRARQFVAADFERFDYVLAMDESNFANLSDLRAEASGTAGAKLALLRAFEGYRDGEAPFEDLQAPGVPDPYYGGARGFDDVFDLCWASCEGLLRYIRQHHDLP